MNTISFADITVYACIGLGAWWLICTMVILIGAAYNHWLASKMKKESEILILLNSKNMEELIKNMEADKANIGEMLKKAMPSAGEGGTFEKKDRNNLNPRKKSEKKEGLH